MRKTTVERANFRLIETELYNFHDTLNELEELKSDIIYSAPIRESEVRSPGISNTTQQKALQIVSSSVIMELARRVNAIQYALNVLKNSPDRKRYELVEKKYFERSLTDTGIMQALSIEQATFYRWRKDAIHLVAQKLGWKV